MFNVSVELYTLVCIIFLLWKMFDRLKMNTVTFKATMVKQGRDTCNGQLRWLLHLILVFLG